MAMIFAPNHKGEDMLGSDQAHNWVHQITLTRNIRPSRLVSYIFGGLDRQVEHHLFPTMSRFKYPTAQRIVRQFCNEKNIPYKETTWVESLRQIHHSLKLEAKQWH
jgi:fatty acid desaturase